MEFAPAGAEGTGARGVRALLLGGAAPAAPFTAVAFAPVASDVFTAALPAFAAAAAACCACFLACACRICLLFLCVLFFFLRLEEMGSGVGSTAAAAGSDLGFLAAWGAECALAADVAEADAAAEAEAECAEPEAELAGPLRLEDLCEVGTVDMAG